MKKTFLFSSILVSLIASSFPDVTSAAVTAADCAKSGSVLERGICVPSSATTGLSASSIPNILKLFLQWILSIFSGLALLVLVFAGLRYLSVTADEKAAEEAKDIAKYAIIGLFVTLSSLVIIRTIENLIKATGTPGTI